MDLAHLLQLRSRGEVKRWGAWLDQGAGQALRGELEARARSLGVDAPATLDGKRLLRASLDRAGPAQVRSNPIARDEAFTCLNCGHDVPVGGRRPRDHCPACLHSLHVDDVPGDRAANCGGLLVPMRLEPAPKAMMIVYRCASCGMERRNRVLDDIERPDEGKALRNLLERAASIG